MLPLSDEAVTYVSGCGVPSQAKTVCVTQDVLAILQATGCSPSSIQASSREMRSNMTDYTRMPLYFSLLVVPQMELVLLSYGYGEVA